MIRSVVLTIFSLGIAFIVSASGQVAYGQQSAACDPDFSDVVTARASLEATREVEIAQRLILKPDSVLEYSCFKDRIEDANRSADNIFSDNVVSGSRLFQDPVREYTPGGPYPAYLPTIEAGGINNAANNTGNAGVVFGAQAPGGPISTATLGNLLGMLVSDSLFRFVYDNFGHDFAGDTYTGGLSSVCDPMNRVWQFVKCTNFNAGLFVTFEQLAAVDPRIYPVVCNSSGRSSAMTATIAAANPLPGAIGGIDTTVTYVDQFVPSCAGVDPIPTGLRVFAQGPAPNRSVQELGDDFVCTAPGCYYNRASGDCEN